MGLISKKIRLTLFVKKIIKISSKSKKPVLVYSFFRAAGNALVRKCLVRRGVPESKIGEIHGGTSKIQLKRILNKFNAGRLDYILLNKAGNTGIDLDGIKTIFILEAQWNQADVNQAIARATRLNSKVKKIHVFSIVGRGKTELSNIDDHLFAIMQKKAKLNKELDEVLREASIPMVEREKEGEHRRTSSRKKKKNKRTSSKKKKKNRRISSRASQNPGTVEPSRMKPRTNCSKIGFLTTVETVPKVMPTIEENRNAIPPSAKL